MGKKAMVVLLAGFHPSLGIPLIITPFNLLPLPQDVPGFHPSLGIPLIITRAAGPRG